MSSPASCEGGGVKSRQPGGGGGDPDSDESGELGVEAREVRVDMSEASSRSIIVVLSAGGAVAAAQLAACGGLRSCYFIYSKSELS